jgi:hypothetical protein
VEPPLRTAWSPEVPQDVGGELSVGSHLAKLRFGQYAISKSVM